MVNSKALIEAAIHEVGDGNMYAEKASTSLREVVDGIQAIADSAKKIKEISIESGCREIGHDISHGVSAGVFPAL